MHLTHTVEEVKVFHIQGLNVFRQLVMIGTLALAELLIGSGGRCGIQISEVLLHDVLHLLFHLRHLLVRDIRQPDLQSFLQFRQQELHDGIPVRVAKKILVMNLIILHLEQQQATLLYGAVVIVEPRLELQVKLAIHI